MLGVVHAEYVHYHPINELRLAISLGMEGNQLDDFGVQQFPEAWKKCAHELAIPIWYNGLWDPKMYPYLFKK